MKEKDNEKDKEANLLLVTISHIKKKQIKYPLPPYAHKIKTEIKYDKKNPQ